MTSNSGNPASGGAPNRQGSGKARVDAAAMHRGGNIMVMATIACVIFATLIAVKPLSPIIYAAAIVPFYYSTMRRRDHRWSLILTLRWAIALFVSILVVGVFAPDRVAASLPLVAHDPVAVEAWIRDIGGTQPASLSYLLWGMTLFLAVTLASGGFLGFVFGALAIGAAAHTALLIFRHGVNLIQSALVALPLWDLCFLAALLVLLVPAGLPMFERFVGDGVDADRSGVRTWMLAGAGLFVLSLILGVALPGVCRSLLERWTVF